MDPTLQLNRIMRNYPDTGKYVNVFRQGLGVDLPSCPPWCFLPMAAWYAIISAHNNHNDFETAGDVAKLAALGTWRYTKGIYQIHPDLLAALFDSAIFGNLPGHILKRLPEWCIYIETPKITWLGEKLHGFFAHLEWDVNHKREELRLLINFEDGSLMPLVLHIGDWTIDEAIKKMIDVSIANQSQYNFPISFGELTSEEYIQATTEGASKLISLLLYICSDDAEIENLQMPNSRPNNPTPKKTKKGLKMFSVENITTWTIGNRIGEKLRVQKLVSPSFNKEDGKSQIRNGHWHGYWTGSKNDGQKFIYKWIPPVGK